MQDRYPFLHGYSSYLLAKPKKNIKKYMPANDHLIANSLSLSQYCYTACSVRYVCMSARVCVCVCVCGA